jgi:hypothetical protein
LFKTMFGDPRLAASIGRRHRVIDPAAAARGRALVRRLAAGGSERAAHALRRTIADDLARLDVTVVDGWVMARAEADFCAAVDLDRGQA